jgi:hypothetical protein
MLDAHNVGYVDPGTIKTFAGSTAGVFAVCTALRRAFRLDHPAIPFVLSMLLCFGLAATDGVEHGIWTWVVALINGCLLYLAVIGANEAGTAAVTRKPVGDGRQEGEAPRPPARFLASYFH